MLYSVFMKQTTLATFTLSSEFESLFPQSDLSHFPMWSEAFCGHEWELLCAECWVRASVVISQHSVLPRCATCCDMLLSGCVLGLRLKWKVKFRASVSSLYQQFAYNCIFMPSALLIDKYLQNKWLNVCRIYKECSDELIRFLGLSQIRSRLKQGQMAPQ